LAPACNDFVKNGSETDVDCGGKDCTAQCLTGGTTCFQCAVNLGCTQNIDCKPPTGHPAVVVSGICDTNSGDAAANTCVNADVLQVAVTGPGTGNGSTVALSTGAITSCKSAGAGTAACVQTYADQSTVTLTATPSAASGTITWTGVPGGLPSPSCPSGCAIGSPPPDGGVASCGTCTFTLNGGGATVGVTTP
jgi:hypothetical protein